MGCTRIYFLYYYYGNVYLRLLIEKTIIIPIEWVILYFNYFLKEYKGPRDAPIVL